MLTGLFPPTSGTAFLYGRDIRTEIEQVRNSFGVCPQHDILFNDLTVQEHLNFYCTLKGILKIDQINQEVRRYAALLGLSDKLHQITQTLSVGMKRKLSVAIALCANPKIVILDEPTAGMDPQARRELWNVLLSEKGGRTILLNTHLVDEAEALGDRIAIMSDGALRAAGSSFFLKQKFGTGYRIVCEKSRGFNSRNVLTVLKEFASEARVECENDTEIAFIVDERRLPIFDKMLKALEDRSKDLKIPSFGCSLSSFEDVFTKLGAEASVQKPTASPMIARNDPSHVTIYLRGTPNVTGIKLFFYQIEAIFTKKFKVFYRSWKSLLAMLVISLTLLFFNSVNSELNEWEKPEKMLNISLSSFGKTVTIIEGNGPVAEGYKNLFHGKDEVFEINRDLENFVLKIANKSILSFNKKHIIGASFKNDSIIAWFNGQSYHSMPLTINTINRALVKAFRGDNYEIETYNHPYDEPDMLDNFYLEDDEINLIVLTVEVTVLLFFWPFVFTIHYVTERESSVKLLQFISGMSKYVYWIASFVFDLVAFFILWCLLFGYVWLVTPANLNFYNIPILMIISMTYAFSMLPFSYLCSFAFKKSSTFIGALIGAFILCKLKKFIHHSLGSFIIFVNFKLVSIAALAITPSMLDYDTKVWHQIANWIGLALPPYSLVADLFIAVSSTVKSEIGKRKAKKTFKHLKKRENLIIFLNFRCSWIWRYRSSHTDENFFGLILPNFVPLD